LLHSRQGFSKCDESLTKRWVWRALEMAFVGDRERLKVRPAPISARAGVHADLFGENVGLV